jgi:hypothetical protein
MALVCVSRSRICEAEHTILTAQHTFYPPFKMCPNSTCDRTRKGLLLGKAEQRKAVYFSLFGALPAYSVQLYCECECYVYQLTR